MWTICKCAYRSASASVHRFSEYLSIPVHVRDLVNPRRLIPYSCHSNYKLPKMEMAVEESRGRATADTIGVFNVTFLGTASAQPSATRNHSSLALRLGADVWLFDCGEATQHQISKSRTVKRSRINKIFITHTHGKYLDLQHNCLFTTSGV